MIPVARGSIGIEDWAEALSARSKRKGSRFGHLAVRRDESGKRVLEGLLLDVDANTAEILSAAIPDGATEFPSITHAIPAAHWAERMVGDFWGLRATGHPRWKSLILHEAWSPKEFPFALPADGMPSPRETHFMKVSGEGVHEIPVGPIHAGIIEPGHFRFSCLGEVVANLEIRLGYQHRGVEARLTEMPWQQARHVAESASSDATVAYALAHAEAIECLLETPAPRRAAALRTLALEIERIANHLGDLGALGSDIGFILGAGAFGRLRGSALGLAQILSGSRFQRGFVCPGGLSWDVDRPKIDLLRTQVSLLKPQIEEACRLFFKNPGVQERLEGAGILQPSLAEEFGMNGPTARASGGAYDARRHFSHGLYPDLAVQVATEAAGDAFARAKVRRKEVFDSLRVIESIFESIPDGIARLDLPEALPTGGVGVAVVESWRGELIHWITTDGQGKIGRYVIRDPSFQNWTGLAIAARHNLVADFPLINKSFNLSYSGNDL